MSMKRLATCVGAVLIALATVDLAIRTYFIPGFARDYYVRPFKSLRDRTGGQNLRVLLDAIPERRGGRLRIATVGDSTMNAVDGAETTMIPYQLESELWRHFGAASFEVVDFSVIGLHAVDAALMVNKVLGGDFDVLVYGVQLRAFPTNPSSVFATNLRREQSPSDLLRLQQAGGSRMLWRVASVEDVLSGVVASTWAAYSYRNQLRLWAGTLASLYLPPGLARVVQQSPPRQNPPTGPAKAFDKYYWARAGFEFSNPNWDGLQVIGRLCAQHRRTACVLYAGPVSPVDRQHLAEPGLFAEFLQRTRMAAEANRLVWRDYTDSMEAEDFYERTKHGTLDRIHLNSRGRQRMAALLVEPIEDALLQRSGSD